MRYKNRNTKILIFLGVIICLMTAAYAAFYSELNITGTSNITNSWNVEITGVTVGTTTGNGKNVSTPTWNALTASMEADIYESGDSVSYNVTVANLGTLDAKLDDITKNIKTNNEAVKITFSGYTKGERLYKHGEEGSTKTITVTISYNDDYEGELNYNTSTETSITLNYVQAEGNNTDPENPIPTTYLLTYDYSTNGGTSTTSENEYYKTNTEVHLSGTAYKKGYTFVGWNTNKDAINGLTDITIDGNKTVYAIYKKEAITLTAKWNANGATLSNTADKTCTIAAVYNNATQDTSCTVDAPTITAPANTPTVVGFNDSASATTNNASYNTNTKKLTLTSSNNNKTWYAITTKAKVDGKVTFNPNGNTKFTYGGTDYTSATAIKICEIAATYNGTAQASTCKASITMPTITAHSNTTTVIGWSTAANTHTATYTSGQTNVELTSGSTYYAQTSSGAATTLTAKWNANGATLSSTADKTCTLATTYNGEAKATSCTVDAPTITRDGFTITGFNDSASATTNNSSYNTSTKKLTLTSSNNNKTWYAITKKDVAITFSKGANTSAIGATSGNCTIYNTATSCAVTAPSITPNTGYSSAGWSTTNGATTGVAAGSNITGLTANATYYGNSKANTYTVTANANGGSISSTTGWTGTGNTATKAITYDAAYGTLPTVTKAGYTFNGWKNTIYGESDLINSIKWTPNQNVTVTKTDDYVQVIYNQNTSTPGYIVWGENTTFEVGKKYTISAYIKGINLSSIAVGAYGDSISLSPISTTEFTKVTNTFTYTKNNQQFLLIYNSSPTIGTGFQIKYLQIQEGENASDFDVDTSTIVKQPSNHTLYADWKINTYSIGYTLNGGSVATANPTSYTVATDTITLNNPTRTGYTFAGWTGSNGTTAQTTVTIPKGSTGNKSYTANWNINSYNVTYNYSNNGGTSATKTSATVNYDANIDLTPTATKSGWTFVGWNTNKDATTGLSSLKMGTSNVTLYAIFRKEAVTLTAKWNANGASLASTADKTCTLAAVYNNNTQATSCTVDAPTITRSGFTIVGYNTAASSTANNSSYNTSTGKLTITSSNNNTTWYAVTKKDVAITFSKGANTASIGASSGSCTIYNTATSCAVTTPSITSNSTYTPAGWSTTNGATTGVAAGSNITGLTANATYYGNSIADTVTLSIATTTTTSTITITATASATSGIKSYAYTIDGNTATCKSGTAANICTVEGLTHNTSHSISVTVTANSNKTATSTITKVYNSTDITENTVTENDGLYTDSAENGRYVYKGANPNNYICLDTNSSGSCEADDLYRIIAIESDGTLKVIKNTSIGNIPWDLGYSSNVPGISPSSSANGTRYSSDKNDYCYASTNSSAYGCNSWGNISNTYSSSGTTKVTSMPYKIGSSTTYTLPKYNSYMNVYLNGGKYLNEDNMETTIIGWLENQNSTIANNIVDYTYNIGMLNSKSGQTIATDISLEAAYKWKGKAALMTVSDYIRASNNSECTGLYAYLNTTRCYNNSESHNWLFNSTKQWTLTPISELSYTVASIRSVASVYPNCFSYYYDYSVRPVFHLSSDINLTGNGTIENAYRISSEGVRTKKIDAPTYSSSKNVVTINYPGGCTNYTCQYSTNGGSSWTTVTTNTKAVTFNAPGTVIGRVTDKTNVSNVVTASTYTFAPAAENLSYDNSNTGLDCTGSNANAKCALDAIKDMLG